MAEDTRPRERSARHRLILASRSPQRRAILDQLGVEFEVDVPEVEELEEGPGAEVAAENARRKALAVAQRRPEALVLGVDTVVCLEGRIYGKASAQEEARQTLSVLSGRRHEVIGGLCLIDHGRCRCATATTGVHFRPLQKPLLDWYLESGEWPERAGCYAIQGRGAALVEAVEGDYLNVVGLPVAVLLEMAPEILIGPVD